MFIERGLVMQLLEARTENTLELGRELEISNMLGDFFDTMIEFVSVAEIKAISSL